MLKLLIVEDEKWEREGLIDFLDWKSLGAELAGLACDGFEGIDKARSIRPEIIITDIKMPGMDGLKMSSTIRTFLPNVKIIILTGYDDFKLAKEAISISANAYILKPVEEAEMEEVFRKVVEECRQDIRKEQEEEKLRELLDEAMHATRRELLSGVLKENASNEMIRQISSLDILPSTGKYAVIAARLSGLDELGAGDRGKLNSADIDLNTFMADEADTGTQAIAILHQSADTVFIILYRQQMNENDLSCLAGLIADKIIEQKKCRLTAGIGSIIDSIGEIHHSCQQAKEVLEYGLFWNRDGIVMYAEMEELQQDNAAKVGEFLTRGNFYTKQIMHSIRAADGEKMRCLLEEMFLFLNSGRWASHNIIANYLCGLLNETSLLFYNPDLSEIDEETAGLPLLSLSDFIAMKEYVCGFFKEVIERIHARRSFKDDYVVKKVEQIIFERYMSDINIKMIAAEIYLSPNYLGSIFKKSTGISVTDYLCQYRMEKAKELLRSPKSRISGVAEAVGIPNVSYFCSLFKDMFGIAPGEYREMILRDGI